MSRSNNPNDRRDTGGYTSRERSSRPTSNQAARPSGARSASYTRSSAQAQRPAATPSRTSASRPTATPSRTNAQRPTATPSRTNAQRPTATPSRTNAGRPSAQPSRTSAQRPTATPSRTSTARAGSASRPIASQEMRPTASKSAQSSRAASSTQAGARKKSAPSQKKPPASRSRSKRKKMRPRWGRLLLLALAVLLCVKLVPMALDRFGGEEEAQAQVQSVKEPLVSDADKPGFDETIDSDSAILINPANGDILYEKDADAERAPASLVKMMTVYVAIKNCDDVDRELQMPKEAYKGLEESLASQSGLRAGETVTVRDLLYATLLESGGDAANALALVTSGNIKSFVELMNDEAKNMGLDSTVFKNPIGLDEEGQVSTCRDMARLVKGALGNSLFKEVFTARSYTTTVNDTHPEGLTLSHTMTRDLNSFRRYFNTSGYEIIGGKTGYTEAAGNCLVTLAKKPQAPAYVVVTMHATGKGDQYYQAFHDAVTLYGTAYEHQKKAPVAQDGSFE